MKIPYISIVLIIAGVYLIKIGRIIEGFLIIIATVALNIIIQLIGGGGLDAFKRN